MYRMRNHYITENMVVPSLGLKFDEISIYMEVMLMGVLKTETDMSVAFGLMIPTFIVCECAIQ